MNAISKITYTLAIVATLQLSGCGYNTMVDGDEKVKAAWSEVVNQYQRRADLVPNLVKVVKASAEFEKDVLTSVVDARSKATSIQATPELLNDPQAFSKFQAAQSELGGALSRLMVTVERYPDLKASQGYRDLQVQIEGTENRITVARGRYIKEVQMYNSTVRKFPSNLTASMFGFETKPNFSVENESAISKPPELGL